MKLFRQLVVSGAVLVTAQFLAGQTSSSLAQVYETAARSVRAGQYTQAERIIRASISFPQLGSNQPVEKMRDNARLLALLGVLVARPSSTQTPDLFSAESYVAWAIHLWPCSLVYWEEYVDIRLRRQGRVALLSSIKAHQQPAYAIPGSEWTIGPPVPDHLLQSVVSVWAEDRQRGVAVLQNQVNLTGRCTVPYSSITTPSPRRPNSSPVSSDLDVAIGQLERGDFKAARRSVDAANWTGSDIERELAQLVVSLALFDGNRAAGSLTVIERTDACAGAPLRGDWGARACYLFGGWSRAIAEGAGWGDSE